MDIKTLVPSLASRCRSFAARRRITFNQVFFAAVLLFLTHPRSPLFFAMGFAIGMIGACIRIWAKGTLVRNTRELITGGPYRFARHPMYLGTLLECLGVCLASFSFRWIVSSFLLAVIFAGYFIFVYKEAMLLEEEEQFGRHGDLWEYYALRTPALFPRVDDLNAFRAEDMRSFNFRRFEISQEWKSFLIFLGVLLLLWFKLVYKL